MGGGEGSVQWGLVIDQNLERQLLLGHVDISAKGMNKVRETKGYKA